MKLDSSKIIESSQIIHENIENDFKESSLRTISHGLINFSKKIEHGAKKSKSMIYVKIGVVLLCLIIAAAPIITVSMIFNKFSIASSSADFMQGVDAFVNEVVFAGIAIYFLSSIEVRLRRKKVFKFLHELRSIAHVIDMHQLRKNSNILNNMKIIDMKKYLIYCTELLSIVSTNAAYTVQNFHDSVTVDAVNDLESLCGGLSRKIWQKITYLSIHNKQMPT